MVSRLELGGGLLGPKLLMLQPPGWQAGAWTIGDAEEMCAFACR